MIANILLLTVTAYYNPAHSLDASGHLPVAGITVAASRKIPLGTHVWVEGVGERVVTDRLVKRFDSRVDVFFNSRTECLKFGKQQLKVTIWQNNQKSITNKQSKK